MTSVSVAVPPDFDATQLADQVEAVSLPDRGWVRHVREEVPRVADRVRADVIFVPNALPPRDARAVMYFQDLYHFQPFAQGFSMRRAMRELARSGWRSYAAPVCRLAVSVSTDIYRHVVRRLHIAGAMIPNGVDVGSGRWTGGGDRIVVMGGHGERKGEEVALRAWSRLGPGVRRHLRLEIIGVQPEARRHDLALQVGALGLNGSVSVTGAMPREAFLERISGSTLAISCSRLEAFGLPVAEALAMGAPVIASDIPSHRELIARAGAGITAAAGDVNDLARRISAALNGAPPSRLTSPPLGWSWRDRAREHVDAYLAAAS